MSTPSAHCIFCDIIRGAAEVSVCYEDDVSLAFMDVQPVNPTPQQKEATPANLPPAP